MFGGFGAESVWKKFIVMLLVIVPNTLVIDNGSIYVNVVNPAQLEKQSGPNNVTEDGIVIEVNPEQPLKHELLNEVTEDRIVIEVNLEQLLKHDIPNEVTNEPMDTDVKTAPLGIV